MHHLRDGWLFIGFTSCLICTNLEKKETYLINGCRKGNAQAQRDLYEHYKTEMFRLCLRYARDRQEAEDFLQEGFIKVFLDFRQYSGKGPLGAWIRRVVLNVILQQLRRRREVYYEIDAQIAEETESEEPDSDPMLDLRSLTLLLQQLPEGYRAVFNLYVLEECSHQEIAENLGISINTSKTQLWKARRMLRNLLEHKLVGRLPS